MTRREGVKKSENFDDIISGSPLEVYGIAQRDTYPGNFTNKTVIWESSFVSILCEQIEERKCNK